MISENIDPIFLREGVVRAYIKAEREVLRLLSSHEGSQEAQDAIDQTFPGW